MSEALPENIDVTYPDKGPGDAAHQHHHDVIHAAINGLSKAVRSVLVVTGSEPRPANTDVVFWIGGSVTPANMGTYDVWLTGGAAPVTPPPSGGDTTPPGVPTGLASSNITTTGFTVTWTAPTDNVAVTGYEVRVNGLTVSTQIATTYSATGKTAGTPYTVEVRARDAAGNFSAWSPGLVVTTAGASPGPTHTIFGSANPHGVSPGIAEPSLQEDGGGGLWVANYFEFPQVGWSVTGARIWIPVGATGGALSTPITLAAWDVENTPPDHGFSGGPDGWLANVTRSKVVSGSFTPGTWVEAVFDTPVTVTGKGCWIGYKWSGNFYVFAADTDTADLPATDSSGVVLNGTTGTYTARSANSFNTTGTVFYGVDLTCRAPG